MILIDDKNYEEVVKQNETVIIDFWATWCGPCRALGPIIEEVSESHKNVVFGKCDVDANPDLCAKFKISSIPFVVKIKNGVVVDSFLGLHDAQFVEEFFKD